MKTTLIIAAFLVTLISGCGTNAEVKEESGATVVTDTDAGRFWTVTHDGHTWVAWRSGYGGGLAHHPDCPCGK